MFAPSEKIVAKRIAGKGLGVFARVDIAKDELIEAAPVLVVPTQDAQSAGRIADYCFAWQPGKVALTLGFGSLYNHSYEPNARYSDRGSREKVFIALRKIRAGEEITINYNGDPKDRSPMDFEIH